MPNIHKNSGMQQVITELHKTKFPLIAIATIIFLGLGINEAYADVPNIDTFVADDPDNGDIVYSVGDTFTLTFSLPINVTAGATMSQAAINGNFTLSGGAVFGTTYSGLWSGDTLTLTITVNTVGAPIPVIGVTTVSETAANNLGHAGDPPTALQLTGAPILSGDYGVIAVVVGGSSQCNGDCTPPTLGLTKTGNRLVENGFSYNGNPVNVDYFYTHYPLITADVGRENVATFKIYEDGGPQNIRHFALAFGIGHGKIFSDSKAIIEWDKSWNGYEKVNVIDPENSLENVKIITSTGTCRNGDVLSNDCLIINVYHTFRQSLDFNIVGTFVWDHNRNSANNYYNDGVKVEGDSLNPPKQHLAIHRGQPVTITEIEDNIGIDQEGNSWTFDKEWQMDYLPQGKIDDGLTSKGIERDNVKFNTYKQGQALIAQNLLQSTEDGKLIKPKTLAEPISYEIDFTDRSEDIQLQNHIAYEKLRSSQWFAEHFVVTPEDEFNKYLNIYKKFHEQNE
jgi:hypothetical protein